ncbi:heme-binding protein [Pseudomonas sp.]|nr:heme-binding protein [Pseudomonas sp.]
MIGSVTVSGLPDRQDHQIVVEALCDLLGHERAELALP